MTDHPEQHFDLVTLPRSVIEQVLEVLADALGSVYYPDQKVVIEALRAARDQPPAALRRLEHRYAGDCPDETQPDARDPDCPACQRLSSARQPQRKPLTEAQIDALLLAHGRGDDGFHGFARAIKATIAKTTGSAT